MMFFDAINTLWIGMFKYGHGERSGRHYHDFFQLIYIKGGKGYLYIKDEEYLLKKDQMYLCPIGYDHEFISDQWKPLETIDIKFSIDKIEMSSMFANVYGLIEMNPKVARSILESSVEEAQKNNRYSHDLINSNIFNLLLKMLLVLDQPEEQNKGIDQDMDIIYNYNYKGIDFGKLFTYMNENIGKQITLEDLAELVGFNSTYLCRVFKSKYGIPPIQYINQLRLRKAKELLKCQEYNITDIADMLGFQSVHYFSRYFKKNFKVSPLEYKRRYSNKISISFEKNMATYLVSTDISHL